MFNWLTLRSKKSQQMPAPKNDAVPAQRLKRAPVQGPKVTNRISGESDPLVCHADESLSVLHEYDQQRRTFCEAVCEEWAGAAAGDRAS
jgi:hypothetical protein